MENTDLRALREPFPEQDIEWRVSRCGETNKGIWADVVAYVSARAIQDRLDEVVGPERWQTSYTFIGTDAGVICKLSILCGGQWIAKEDGAEQTDIESFKGGISSALKRAGSAWGIGRYLYDLDGGFAKIVEKGAPGARYAQTKDRKPFYWVPPKLPDWALPKAKKTAPTAQSAQPNVVPITEPVAALPDDPGDYIWTFGAYKGERTKDIPNLRQYCQGIRSKAESVGKKPQQQVVTALEMARSYLDFINQDEIPAPMEDGDMPA
jgi:hypothetical protein